MRGAKTHWNGGVCLLTDKARKLFEKDLENPDCYCCRNHISHCIYSEDKAQECVENNYCWYAPLDAETYEYLAKEGNYD